jgi:regulator of protease activity HflC (stomatin/prohibitin superfamily)
VQYQVIEAQVKDAHYKLTSPHAQIKSYVEDVIRGAIPQKTLDDSFSSKDALAHAVRDQLQEKMSEFGYDIVKALVTDLSPDRGVKASMNEINAQKRLKEASTAKADGEKILMVKAAEADKEAKYLSGLGVAQQRRYFCDLILKTIFVCRQLTLFSLLLFILQCHRERIERIYHQLCRWS